MNSDLLDEYCEEEFGHKNWSMDWDEQGNMIITFLEIQDLSILKKRGKNETL